MSTQLKVKKLMNDLVNQDSFVNVLDIALTQELGVNPETAKTYSHWFDIIDTNRFCNTFIALNPEYNNKFTTIERSFRRVREVKRLALVNTNETKLVG